MGTGRNANMKQKKGGVKAHTVIRADQDVPVFVNITDAIVHDHALVKDLNLQKGDYVTFDRGYIDYKAWENFSHAWRALCHTREE